MNTVELTSTFRLWCAGGEPLVLASVYETSGSTYSKVGTRMLINAAGDYQGMLSGGCLEGDLAEHAAEVLRSGVAHCVNYDLAGDNEELWGLGVGCDGSMSIFLQPLEPPGYHPFSDFVTVLEGELAGMAATVIESRLGDVPVGSGLLVDGPQVMNLGLPITRLDRILRPAREALQRRESSCHHLEIDGQPITLLLGLLKPPPRILILGAGLDARPVVAMAASLGWRTIIADHRSAYVEKGVFPAAEAIICSPAEEMTMNVDLDRVDAVIVMSHHLDSDRSYLRQLANSNIPYVGLLGPPNRRERLLAELGDAAGDIATRLNGPAGLDIGARGPAAIALSIVAQIQKYLA